MQSPKSDRRSPLGRLRHWLRPRVSRPLVALACRIAPAVYAVYLRVVFATSRVDDDAFRPLQDRDAQAAGSVHLFWHEGLLALAYAYQRLGLHTWALVGLGDGGDVLTRVLRRCGHQVVRGGSSGRRSRRSATTVAELIAVAQAADAPIVAVAVDGTRGPAGYVKSGGLVVAARCGLPIHLVRVWARYNLRLRTWDRFAIPLPFNRIRYACYGPIEVPRNAGYGSGLEDLRAVVEGRLRDLADETDHRLAGSPPRAHPPSERVSRGQEEGTA